MQPLKSIHRWLLKNRVTRSAQLRLARNLRVALGMSDPYFDLARLAERWRPAAFLDVGSYVGETVAFLLQGTTTPVHAFEPTPASFQKLSARFGHHPRVTLHAMALGDRDGAIELFENRNPQTNSILDNDCGNERAFGKQTAHLQKFTAPIATLDRWAKDHLPEGELLIKCDVQGAEGRFIAGGRQTLAARVIAIFSEAQLGAMYSGQADFFEVHSRLVELGFVLHNIYECHQDQQGRATQTDALWIREDRLG